jgi:transposase
VHDTIGVGCTQKVWLQWQKKRKSYYEADEQKRNDYLEKIAPIDPSELVYVDETGFDEYYSRERAYSKRGVKVFGKVYGRRIFRINLVAGLHKGKILAEQLYTENTKYQLFEEWFEKRLIPGLQKGCTIVMDNARFHRKKVLEEMASQNGFRMIFLPPYSPDFNPIEKKWGNTKRYLRKAVSKHATLQNAILYYLKTV